jgi:hypothetical protein
MDITIRITVRRVVQYYAATGAAPVSVLEEGPASTAKYTAENSSGIETVCLYTMLCIMLYTEEKKVK